MIIDGNGHSFTFTIFNKVSYLATLNSQLFYTNDALRLGIYNDSIKVTEEFIEVFGTGTVATDAVTINAQTGWIDTDSDADGFVWTNSYIRTTSIVLLFDMEGTVYTTPISITCGAGTATVVYLAAGAGSRKLAFIIRNP